MAIYTITITAQYEVELENFERDRRAISKGITMPEFPDFIPEEDIEFLGADITYLEGEEE